jgi:imidazolonepropionase
MSTLFINIKALVQVRQDGDFGLVKGENMARLPMLEDAFLLVEGNIIKDFGSMYRLPEKGFQPHETFDLLGRYVFPSFVDSHSHIVFAGSRENEFVDKIKGLSYEEISKRGGGIHNSAARLGQTSEHALLEQSLARIDEVIASGTGAIEIKSGYGLNTEAELKMLRVAKKIGKLRPIEVKTTFLGAHAIPPGMDRKEYIRSIKEEMLPKVAEEGLADYCDVFCEKGFFTPEESEDILRRALDFGLKPRVHANQLYNSGGLEVGVKLGALSVDHLEVIGDKEIEILKGSSTIPTLLPGAAWFLNAPFPPARKMIDAGLGLAIASDFNPGSSPTGNIPQLLSMSCVKMKMLPEEVFNASTLNTANALELQHQFGSISIGKKASLFITKPIPSIAYIPYMFGSNPIEAVMLKGDWIFRGGIKRDL